MKLQNKVALITGGGKGIGKAISLLFAQEGAKVIVNYSTSKQEADQVVQEIEKLGATAMSIQADVSVFQEVDTMITQVIERFGTIDVLVNNAGILISSPFEETTEQIWDTTIDTNLKGAFLCIKAVLPYLKKQNHGKVVSISSMVAFVGSLVSVPYGVSKAGIVNMTKTLSKELGKYNITINSVAPGPTDTDLLKSLNMELREKLKRETPLGRVAEPEDIAKAVLFFASSDSDFITGQTLIVDGGRI